MGVQKQRRPLFLDAGISNGLLPQFLGYRAFSALAVAGDATGIFLPADMDDRDLFIINASVNGNPCFHVVTGREFNGLTAGTAGTQLGGNTSFSIYSGNSTTRRARVGRTAAGEILLDPQGAAAAAWIQVTRFWGGENGVGYVDE